MPDDPIEPTPEAPRDLSTILSDLETLSSAQLGAHAELRLAVSELSRSLAGLFETVRTERADQRVRIAELEAELARAQAKLTELGQPVGPAADDFDQLRAAAEQLRARTESLVKEAMQAGGPPAGEEPVAAEESTSPEQPRAQQLAQAVAERAVAAPKLPELEPDEDEDEKEDELPRQAVLTVFPGTVAPSRPTEVPSFDQGGGLARAVTGERDLEVESDLDLDPAFLDPPEAIAVALPVPAEASDERAPEVSAPSPRQAPAVNDRGAPEPIVLSPKPETKRKRFRRRRIDARKLSGVEPTAALRAMVDAVEPVWTAGCSIDLIVALTDGATLRVCGGDTELLRVEDVRPGTSARTTVTTTRDQLVPLFGRLALTDEQSAPLIHGSRRDADLLVAWIDRAQRLQPQPL